MNIENEIVTLWQKVKLPKDENQEPYLPGMVTAQEITRLILEPEKHEERLEEIYVVLSYLYTKGKLRS